ncbi:RICIN domain-containing protein [Acrocarpospora catenulata]|uniref:RICIN domain-containing protein n=1 Tax=Acrocarpospora catenulata TaxID=2836182 RepID=UPI001BDACF0B|nr:RICIN domain-containing protein [Acrocarpospora catenulata]
MERSAAVKLAVATALSLVLATLAVPTQATASARQLMLVNVETGKCLTIAGGVSTDNNVHAVQYTCDTDLSRRWTLESGRGGGKRIRNAQTGKCLTIAGGLSTANNVTALQYNCDRHPSRSWTFSEDGDTGNYWIKNVQTGKCVTIAGGLSTANNVEALQYTCDRHPSRRWHLVWTS